MNETQARSDLLAMGIRPNPALVADYMRAAEAESEMEISGEERAPTETLMPAPESLPVADNGRSSKSNLEPVLRETGQLERPAGPRKPGRPRIIASWFEKVAQTMADGTSLKTALAMNGLSLSKSEVRACYRNETLRALYTEARRRYLAEHYGRKPTLRAKIGRYL